MNIADDISEFGLALRTRIAQLEKQVQQKDQIIQALEKQLNESKSKKD